MGISQTVDVVIAGAGPAGSVAAANLATRGLRVILVEKTSFNQQRPGEFLSPHTRAAIARLDLLGGDWELGHRKVDEFQSAWGSSQPAVHNYIFNPHGHGLVLDRVKFDRSLADSAVARGANLLKRSSVRQAERKHNSWTVVIDQAGNELSVTCGFLLVCSGRAGSPMRGLKFVRRRQDRLFCIAMRVPGCEANGSPATETSPNGWTYSVSLASGELVINLFTQNRPNSMDGRRLSLESFLSELAHCPIASSRLLKAKLACSSDVVFFVSDASSILSRPAVGPGWCLLGDCAQSLDPLSSSGIHQACQHAALVSRAICDSGSIIGTNLAEYESYLEETYAAYIATKQHLYNLERRWTTPFWQHYRSEPRERHHFSN